MLERVRVSRYRVLVGGVSHPLRYCYGQWKKIVDLTPLPPFPRLTLMTRGISVTFELDEQGHRNRSQTIAGTPRTARAWSRPELSLVVADSF